MRVGFFFVCARTHGCTQSTVDEFIWQKGFLSKFKTFSLVSLREHTRFLHDDQKEIGYGRSHCLLVLFFEIESVRKASSFLSSSEIMMSLFPTATNQLLS